MNTYNVLKSAITSDCGRFSYIPEIGIKDSVSKRYVTLEG